MMVNATKLPRVVDYIRRHPLSRGRLFDRLGRFAAWQIASRLAPGPVAAPFVGSTRLLISPGMHGATGNVYLGLLEFHEMAFVLHALRPDELFIDVGANMGVYSVLAAGAVGCRAVAAEPVGSTYTHLVQNIRVNQLEDRIETHQCAVGATNGWANMTDTLDTMNRVESLSESSGPNTAPMTTLDRLLDQREPSVIKIDVEGFEPQVLAGAAETLRRDSLRAVLVETDPASRLSDGDTQDTDRVLRDAGFVPCRYDGVSRSLEAVRKVDAQGANAIYVRDLAATQEIVATAPRFRVLDTDV